MIFFLIGYMASGKTTYGKKLASKINFSFIDMDSYIEKRYRHSINSIFRLVGEEGFRIIEHNTLKEIINLENYVIATGGGTPCYHNNINLINENGISIYLKYTPKFLFSRLVNAKKNRPLIKKKIELEQYINSSLLHREQFYHKAHHIIEKENLKTSDLILITNKYL